MSQTVTSVPFTPAPTRTFRDNPQLTNYVKTLSSSMFSIESLLDRPICRISHNHLSAFVDKSGLACKWKSETEHLDLDLMQVLQHKHFMEEEFKGGSRYVTEFLDAIAMIDLLTDPFRRERAKQGYVQFADLPLVITPTMEAIVPSPSGSVGGVVRHIVLVRTWRGTHWSVALTVLAPCAEGARLCAMTVEVPHFVGEMAVGKLPVRVITAEEKAELMARGDRFMNFVSKPYFASYTGAIDVPTWMGEFAMRADGRVMLDPASLKQIEPSKYEQMMEVFGNSSSGPMDKDDEDSVDNDTVVDREHYWQSYSRIPAFSMRLKKWGWCRVDGLRDVQWRSNALDNLVLDPKIKRKLYNRVKHSTNAYGDFIEDKSGGSVFLLHGPTGQGKTLTAEAVAEALQRPLYSISVGQLGIAVEDIETRLNQIIDLALRWNAVLLLDEADIFMEARDTVNVERNAMVSVFLRTLDYFSGVMFLTTNRIKSFDPAFYSRMSLAIRYAKLDESGRAEVWRNILTAAGVGIAEIDIEKLATYDVNGRNIKQIVRSAQSEGFACERAVTQADIEEELALTAQFNVEVGI